MIGTQYGAVGGSQWMLALKWEPLFCVPNPQERESTVLAEVECWHPLATANGSALSAMSRPVFRFSPTRCREVVLTCSRGRLDLGDDGLHIYVNDNCYLLLETSAFAGFALAIQTPR